MVVAQAGHFLKTILGRLCQQVALNLAFQFNINTCPDSSLEWLFNGPVLGGSYAP